MIELDPIFVACGTMNRELALGIWAKCIRENVWPGYPVRDAQARMPTLARVDDDGLEGRGARRRRDAAVCDGKQGGDIVKSKDDGRLGLPPTLRAPLAMSWTSDTGMTLRQWYAGQALAGTCSA